MDYKFGTLPVDGLRAAVAESVVTKWWGDINQVKFLADTEGGNTFGDNVGFTGSVEVDNGYFALDTVVKVDLAKIGCDRQLVTVVRSNDRRILDTGRSYDVWVSGTAGFIGGLNIKDDKGIDNKAAGRDGRCIETKP